MIINHFLLVGLSLEGFGEEFEIGKIAFELEDLKRISRKEERKLEILPFFLGDFSLF